MFWRGFITWWAREKTAPLPARAWEALGRAERQAELAKVAKNLDGREFSEHRAVSCSEASPVGISGLVLDLPSSSVADQVAK